MNPKKYKKKPVEVEAVQWLPDMPESVGYVIAWLLTNKVMFDLYTEPETGPNLKIETLEGDMHATQNDYIVKGIQGEFYTVKLDIFLATYDNG